MHLTPFQKQSSLVTPSSKKTANQSLNNSQLKLLRKSLLLQNQNQSCMATNENPCSSSKTAQKQRQQQKIKNETEVVIKQLSMSYLYAICENFQQIIHKQMNNMISKILMLECKIAQCQKKFNAVEIQLHKSSKQIGVLVDENCMLIQLNRDIQLRMQQLKQKYQVSYSTVKNQWMTNIVDSLKTEITEFQIRTKQCESCHKNIKERVKRQLSRLQNLCVMPPNQKSVGASTQGQKISAIRQILKSILDMLYSQSKQIQSFELNRWKQTLLQNIDLKFEVMSMKQKLNFLQKSSLRTKNEPVGKVEA